MSRATRACSNCANACRTSLIADRPVRKGCHYPHFLEDGAILPICRDAGRASLTFSAMPSGPVRCWPRGQLRDRLCPDLMNVPSAITHADRECLIAWKRRRDVPALQALAARYLPLVYGSALRRMGNPAEAAEVTRAVFLVLARRAHKLSKRTVVSGWLFHITSVATRKQQRKSIRRWFSRRPRLALPPEAPLWTRIRSRLDAVIDRLPVKEREAILLRCFLKYDPVRAAEILRTRERRIEKRTARGLKRMVRRLRLSVNWLNLEHPSSPALLPVEGRRRKEEERLFDSAAQNASALAGKISRKSLLSAALARALEADGCAALVPEELSGEIFAAVAANGGARPAHKLARRTLASLAWKRWRRRLALATPIGLVLLFVAGSIAWQIDGRTGHSRFLTFFLVQSVKKQGKSVPGLAQPAHSWPANPNQPTLSAARVLGAGDLYQTTNIWQAHLKFTRDQWKAIQPARIDPLPHFFQPDGTVLLRNPQAQRSGLAGVLGFDFHWVQAEFDFGEVAFTKVAARFKGNGTFLGSLYGWKRSFKVDLNEHVKGQKLGRADELTFNNLVVDHSFMSDALAYEFFREAKVPASRTAYAWMTISVEEEWGRKPLGLYLMVEPVNDEFVAERFGSGKTPVFKPVTYQLFEHLGEDWSDYEAIYDLKTKATPMQRQRVIELTRLVSLADDEKFAARVGEFLDLDEFARFLAGEVLLSSYDSILANGQNFYVYLDPRSNRFGFIPWDLDLAWGGFFLLASRQERERASIWHPWVGENRFLERVMNVEEFRRLYRGHLEDFLAHLFVPERLHARIDQLASIIREPIAAESDFRLNKFEQAIGARPLEPTRGDPMGPDRQAHQLKRFIENRARSVRQQLDGKSDGMILKRGGR